MDITTGTIKGTNIVIIHLRGFLDYNSAHEFSQLIAQLIAQSYVDIVIGCEELEYISDHGFSCLFEAQANLRGKNGHLLFAEANSEIKHMLSLLKICSKFSFVNNVNEAKESLLQKQKK